VAATGAEIDITVGLLRISDTQLKALQSLFFTIGGGVGQDNSYITCETEYREQATYEFTANAQFFPRTLNTVIGGSSTAIYLIVADVSSDPVVLMRRF
jgi:hypothetical protein